MCSYLAELFAAGDTDVVNGVLRKLAAMRSYMRDVNLGRVTRPEIATKVGMTEKEIYEMYRLLTIAKYEDRYVIPAARRLQERQTADGSVAVAGASRGNLLNWDGRGTPDGLMPRHHGRHRK